MSDAPLEIEERKQWAGKIHHGTQRPLRLLDKVMLLASLRGGNLKFHLEPVDVRTLVQQAVLGATPSALERKVRIEQTVPGPGTLVADAKLMSTALAALLGNAIRSSAELGTVTIAVTSDDRHARFRIADRGAGLGPDALARVFDEGAGADLEGEADGHGLGLAIAHHIVLGHGGEVAVDSTMGAGTIFTVEFPLAVRAKDAPVASL